MVAGPGLTTESPYQAPCPLGRTPPQVRARHGGEFAHLNLSRTASDTVFSFGVEPARFDGGSALGIDALHDHRPAQLAGYDVERIARLHFARRFGGVAIEPHLAVLNRCGGKAARLEKARGPKPFVDAQCGGGEFVHSFEGMKCSSDGNANTADARKTVPAKCDHHLQWNTNPSAFDPDADTTTREDLTMKPDAARNQLGNNTPLPLRSPFGSVLAMVMGVILLVLGFMFSLLILATAAVLGVLGFGYLWWKTRALRKQVREQMNYAAQNGTVTPPTDGNISEGEIIEGVIIREERETPG